MLIKRLTEANGLPGWEKEVREIIKEELKGHVDSLTTDRLGSVIAVKNADKPGRHLGFSAHMDEVGLIVKSIDASGLMKFSSWGVDLRVLPAKTVTVGTNRVPGVIGTKPIHLQEKEESKNAVKIDDLYVDIGAKSKEEAEKLVSPGDFVAFESSFEEFGEYKIKAKALDDRVGCAILIELLKSDYPYKMTAIFNTQEEVGCRGSAAAAYGVHCDLYINVEGTVCADTAWVEDFKTVNILGKGPSISLMDKVSIYQKKYIEALVSVAEENNIPFQYRRTSVGGTDGGNLHLAHSGTPVIGLAVPCRYIHSPVSVMDKRDFDNALKLLKAFTTSYNEGKIL